MFLHAVDHNVHNRVLGVNFIHSGETISQYFQQTLHAIGELRREYICGPSNSTHETLGSKIILRYHYVQDITGRKVDYNKF